MKTVTIQIGNTDNKLTQQEWADFVKEVRQAVAGHATVHFMGFSPSDAPWQNAAWVCVVPPIHDDVLKTTLARIAKAFRQDSIAWTEGATEFIGGSTSPQFRIPLNQLKVGDRVIAYSAGAPRPEVVGRIQGGRIHGLYFVPDDARTTEDEQSVNNLLSLGIVFFAAP